MKNFSINYRMSSEKDSKYINHSAMSSVDRADPDKGLLSDHEREKLS